MHNRLYLNAGQMKAGTSFLYKIIKDHPEIYFSPEKELHFLSQQFGYFRLLSNTVRLRKAMALLRNETPNASKLGEFRFLLRWIADYLEDPNDISWYERAFRGVDINQYAADFSNLTCTIPVKGLIQIRDLFPTTKITYCVRNAVDRVFSHIKFHLQFEDKAKAIEDLEDEELREFMLSDNILPQSRTSMHINNLVEVFGDQHVRIIRCENMWSHPQKAVDAVCEFLEIEKIAVDENLFKPVNVGPKKKMDKRMRQLIKETMADEIHNTETCLQQYSKLILI